MNSNVRVTLVILLVAFLAGCASSGGRQRGLSCDARLEDYCGGWTIYDSSDVEEPGQHIEETDSLVIGKRRNGNRGYILYARPSLAMRWNNQRIIPLVERKRDRRHDCMVGVVQLSGHSGTPSHEWHALTIRARTLNTPDIGEEVKLEICFNRQDNNEIPDACAPMNCNGGAGDHGGRAHARD